MPEELSGIFTKEEVENINWEEEFTPVLSSLKRQKIVTTKHSKMTETPFVF